MCDLLWEIPDDPRGALRWALTKIRPVVNDETHQRLVADRERVEVNAEDLEIDVQSIASELNNEHLTTARLKTLADMLETRFLDGADIPDQSLYHEWLMAERQAVNRRLRGQVLERLGTQPDLTPDRALRVVQTWCELEPFSTAAATQLIKRLEQLGQQKEVESARAEFEERFQNAGISWQSPTSHSAHKTTAPQPSAITASELQARQKIQFCASTDSVNIAYAKVGEGPPIVKAANWLSHLELDWDAPIWSPLLRELAQERQVVRYDERGNGLSDWDVQDISFDAFVDDLECVVDACDLPQFALLGISQGAAVSIEYAVRYPERVRCLILFGGYPAGWRINASEEELNEREAILTLTKTGWGRHNPAYRQIFSSTFMPSATPEEMDWFNDFQMQTTSAENAVRFLSAFGDIDVREQLAKVRVPTLVIHSLGDYRIPASVGRSLAAAIPNAEFVGLESDGHLLLGREPASRVFIDAVCDFLRRHGI